MIAPSRRLEEWLTGGRQCIVADPHPPLGSPQVGRVDRTQRTRGTPQTGGSPTAFASTQRVAKARRIDSSATHMGGTRMSRARRIALASTALALLGFAVGIP